VTRPPLPRAALAALAALAAALLLPGCSGEPSGDFAATLAGPFEGKMAGGATFCLAPQEGLVIRLEDPSASAGFLLLRTPAELPPAAAYGLVRDTVASTAAFRFIPRLEGLDGGSEFVYRVREGKVRIISSDSAWVKGRFEARIVASDASPEVDPATGQVKMLRTDYLDVTGQFAAARAAECDRETGAAR
jgi:hypothetical protein